MAAFLIYRIFFQDGGVEIKQNIPQNAAAGSEYTVELTIKKGGISGFAKFQQELPAGMTATGIETKSGTFSFTDQTVKIIWMSLPNDKEFTVTYKVAVGQNVAGPQQLGGKFSYIENNEKKTVNLEASTITIENPNQVPAAATTPSSEQGTQTPTTSSSSSSAEAPAPVSGTGSSGLTCTRNIPTITNPEEFVVELNIVRGGVSGFAKLEETLPAGFTATAIEAGNAVFSFVDQKAKFLWMSLPSDSQFKISYKVKKEAGAPSQLTVEGLFSYLENDVTQKVIIPAQQVVLQPGAVAQQSQSAANETARLQNTENTQTQKPQTETQQSVAQNETQSQPQEQKTEAPSETKTTTTEQPATTQAEQPSETQRTAAAETQPAAAATTGAAVKYRVQILAAHKPVDQSYFESNHNITDAVNSEMHEGWHKFTIGSFSDYKQARNKRESVSNNNLPGPFVTAYNGGKRITVQEALMISNQKWVK